MKTTAIDNQPPHFPFRSVALGGQASQHLQPSARIVLEVGGCELL